MQKKIAVINDIAGFGRCAVSVALPIISYLGVQCCPVPTSVFSNNTAYPDYFCDDYTDRMQPYIDQWKKLGLRFDGIATGFLSSVRQMQIVRDFIRDFRGDNTRVIMDPVMGDSGRLYVTYTEELCSEMRKMVGLADILTPNLTECCKLTDTPYRSEGWRDGELRRMAEMLAERGPESIVITGIRQGDYIANYVYEKGRQPKWVRTREAGTPRCGTGDVFSAIIAADSVNGVPFEKSVRKAAGFVKKCVLRSVELEIPENDGVCFEELLYRLKRN